MLDLKLPQRKNLRLGLALGGGGARGLAHIAFFKVLDDLDITPAIISGTSIGALLGAMYCAGLSGAEIEKIYENNSLLKLGSLIDLAIPAIHGLAKGDKIAKFVKKEIGIDSFEELKIPLKIVATDYWNRKQVVMESGNLIKAIRASISVPGIFEPVSHLGRILTDGGAVNPVPYDIISEDCNIIAAIDVTGVQQPEFDSDEMPSIFECIMNNFHILESSLLENKLAKKRPDFLYHPAIVNINILDFTRYREIIEFSESELTRFRDDMLNLKPRLRD